MAASMKPKNGKVTQDVVAEATKAAEESRKMIDSMLEATNKAIEDSKPLFKANQQIFENSLSMWQDYNQNYMNLVVKATDQMLAQNLGFQQEMFKLFETSAKKSQELLTDEHVLAFEAVEAFQAQMQAAYERAAKVFTPNSNS